MAFSRESDPRKREREQVRVSVSKKEATAIYIASALLYGSHRPIQVSCDMELHSMRIPGDGYHWGSYWRLVTTFSDTDINLVFRKARSNIFRK